MHISITAPAIHVSLITLSNTFFSLNASSINTLMNLHGGFSPPLFLLYI
nr:MAG TPA: hypothetical protein [Caudoviricetes sp.]